MASIQTSIQLYDGTSNVLRSINTAMNVVINSFESMNDVSGNAINTVSMQRAREELAKANTVLNDMEKNINEDTAAQKRMNEQIRNGSGAANDLKSTFFKIAGVIGLAFGGGKVIGLSDEMANMNARIGMINDGSRTNQQLQDAIFASAERSRGSFLGSVDAIGKMGIMAKDAFKNNDELIAFTEQINKNFVLAGTNAQGIEAATLQLTQAMGSGVLRGEELNSVFEQAPTIIQKIAKYMGKPIGEIRNMAQQGLITSTIVKNAMLSSAEETNKAFDSMPRTWSQIFQSFKNQSIQAFKPILSEINRIANTKEFEKFKNGAISLLNSVGKVVTKVFNAVVTVGSFIYDNWSMIAPVVGAVVAAFVAYNAVALITNGILAVQAIATGIAGAAQALQTGATFAATAAQWGLNAALYACPLTWIVLAIIAVIAIIYIAINAFNNWAGTSINATGVILGALNTLRAFGINQMLMFVNFVMDIFGYLWNFIANFVEFFANVWSDPIGSAMRLFSGFVTNVINLLMTLTKAIDMMFGSNLTSKLDGFKKLIDEKVANIAGEAKIKVQRYDTANAGFKRMEYGKSYQQGYDFGKNVNMNSLMKGIPGIDKLINNTSQTAGNTAAMKDKMDITSEDLKYMRDLAERDVINKFTTAEIKVDMKNDMTVNHQTDVDGMIRHLEHKLNQTLQATAEGVHS